MYTKDEVFNSTLAYFQGDDLATNVWINKYCLKNKKGELLELTPDDMHVRLAREFARIEKKYPNPISEDQIFQLLKNFKYIIPQGSPMYGIGNDHFITSLSNCFVIGSNNDSDSYGSIMRTDEEQVQLMKRRGGVGHDISHLRPSGAHANNSALGANAGTTLYMYRYSNSTREVSQDGRRGALMLSIDVRHPDVDKFVDIKTDRTKVTGANVSVKVTNQFMEAVKSDSDFIHTFPVEMNSSQFNSEFPCDIEDLPYNKLVKGIGDVYCKRVKAKQLWNKIIHHAWKDAEPGILFWDKIIEESPADIYSEKWKTKSTNPCGEIPLNPYDSCRLLAINLFSFVIEPFTTRARFDFEMFKYVVIIAQRLMDDLVDLEIEKLERIIDKIKSDPEPEEIKHVELQLWEKILQNAIDGRRTGLGITAEGDMLAALGLRYGTLEATDFAELVHHRLASYSYESSITMAMERGAFPIFNKEKEELYGKFMNRIFGDLHIDAASNYIKYGRRNIANLTVAPTGSTSTIAQVTSGIEPLFMPYYLRRRKVEDKTLATFVDEIGDGWEEYKVFHRKFLDWFRIQIEIEALDFYVWYDGGGFDYQSIESWLREISDNLFEIILEASPYYKATSNDVDYFEKVRMQGRIQKWVDHSISVTINMPKETTEETISQCYMLAYESGCKGMTVYRDGSRSGVLIKEEKVQPKNQVIYHDAIKRPEVVECDIYRKTVFKKDWMIIVGLLSGKPVEIFAFEDLENYQFPKNIEKGKVRKVKSKVYELSGTHGEKTYTIPDIVSLIAIDDKSDTRKYSLMLRHGIHPKFIIEQIEEYATIVSFDKAIQRVLKNYIDLNGIKGNKCPNCSMELREEEGCVKCMNCEYSRCG